MNTPSQRMNGPTQEQREYGQALDTLRLNLQVAEDQVNKSVNRIKYLKRKLKGVLNPEIRARSEVELAEKVRTLPELHERVTEINALISGTHNRYAITMQATSQGVGTDNDILHSLMENERAEISNNTGIGGWGNRNPAHRLSTDDIPDQNVL